MSSAANVPSSSPASPFEDIASRETGFLRSGTTIRTYPAPTTQRQLRQFLGLANFYRPNSFE
eukprot:765359-Hanusia_phi.AAC.1